MSAQVSIRFYEELNDFLPVTRRGRSFTQPMQESRSIKDLIESLGVPHTEVDLVIVNGESVDLSYLVEDGEHISVYPVFESLDISPLKHCQPEPLRNTRFVLDAHLGRLAAYLRMLGFDTLYRNDFDDPELASISAEQHRTLLTCDRRLLMRKKITRGYFVRQRQPRKQIVEILKRFELYHKLKPFSRCMHCNGITRLVDKQDIISQLLPKTAKYYDRFYQCTSCHKIYWKGSHYLKMKAMIEELESYRFTS